MIRLKTSVLTVMLSVTLNSNGGTKTGGLSSMSVTGMVIVAREVRMFPSMSPISLTSTSRVYRSAVSRSILPDMVNRPDSLLSMKGTPSVKSVKVNSPPIPPSWSVLIPPKLYTTIPRQLLP